MSKVTREYARASRVIPTGSANHARMVMILSNTSTLAKMKLATALRSIEHSPTIKELGLCSNVSAFLQEDIKRRMTTDAHKQMHLPLDVEGEVAEQKIVDPDDAKLHTEVLGLFYELMHVWIKENRCVSVAYPIEGNMSVYRTNTKKWDRRSAYGKKRLQLVHDLQVILEGAI